MRSRIDLKSVNLWLLDVIIAASFTFIKKVNLVVQNEFSPWEKNGY